MSYLLAVDPGLDEVAFAAFDLARWRPCVAIEEAVKALGPVGIGKTLPKDSWSTRCSELAGYVEEFAAGLDQPIERICVEVPATRNSYRRNRGIQRTQTPAIMGPLMLLHLGIGAVLTGAMRLQCPVYELTASPTPKQARADTLSRILNGLGLRSKYKPDEYDAMWVGWMGLCDLFEAQKNGRHPLGAAR